MVPGTSFREWSIGRQHQQELLKEAAELRRALEATTDAPLNRPSVRDRLATVAGAILNAFETASASTPPEWPGRYRGYR
jgi:hypothetical protein